MRLFAVSDLHVDFGENRRFLQQLSDVEFTRDALIVAGDIAHRIALIGAALELLRRKFEQVFYVPGNHELWVRGESGNSVDKFHKILDVCADIGVRTEPGRADPCWVVPLFSWYDPAFAGSEEAGALDSWGDFRYCRWPGGFGSQSAFFSRLNASRIRPRSGRIVSFSHFLPRPELLPDARHLHFKGLPGVAGSARIEHQLRCLGARVHVFGHSHIRRDVEIDQVRYVQHSLGYPRERRESGFAPKRIA